jgi:alpha-L-rhamnosidase
MVRRITTVPGLAIVCVVLTCGGVSAQRTNPSFPNPLDPAREIKSLVHTPLPEEYVWTAGDVTAMRPDRSRFPWRSPELRTDWHRFRKSFDVNVLPPAATLYVAGPREAEVYLNGVKVANFSSNVDAPIGFHVFHVNALKALRRGRNVLAIRAIRGRGVVSDATPATLQLAYGEVLVAKIVPAEPGVDAPAMVKSDGTWSSVVEHETDGEWMKPGFDDSAWPKVMSLGGVESNRDFMQWSADAGMYGWPGFMGMTAPLGTYELNAVAVTHVFNGVGSFHGLDALHGGSGTFGVTHASGETSPTDAEAPALLLDFGQEVSGRLLVQSMAKEDVVLSIAYGESELEAMATGLTPEQRGGNYLGTNLLDVGKGQIARGPKSGFRYVRVRFLRGSGNLQLKVEGIAYPVKYKGEFESSDALLNQIWETGAYTVHLCMGDDLWDAAKRDRGRWAGDIDVEGRVISDVFGDSVLLERTLTALVPGEGKQVNGIPGYSALWVTSLASLYAHSGDDAFLKAHHSDLLRVLHSMSGAVDDDGGFVNRKKAWMFVDWAPGLYGNTDEAQSGTALQYVKGFGAGAALLRSIGDETEAARMDAIAEKMKEKVRGELSADGAMSWQIAALALQAGVMDSKDAWTRSLSKVKQDAVTDQQISPYFNATVLDAMSQSGHDAEALRWMKAYWGGMLAEGATSFWESYDLRWPKDMPHLSLQADGTSGFFVSMAHGWSSGPTAWLSEHVLGVRDAKDGFRAVTIAPRLMGLTWARGAVPTPQGVIRVEDKRDGAVETIAIDVPRGVLKAIVDVDAAASDVSLDGGALKDAAVGNSEVRFELSGQGHHVVSVRRGAM